MPGGNRDSRPISAPPSSKSVLPPDGPGRRRSSWPLAVNSSAATSPSHESNNVRVQKGRRGRPVKVQGGQQQQQQQEPEDDEVEYVPPDGGWGWVCVGCAAINFFLVVGLTRSFGAIYGDLRAAFPGSTHSQIATIPSIIVTLVVGLAIVAGALSKRFSCRIVAVTGGALCSTGICLCYFANTITILTICFIIAGLGAAMSTTPGILIIAMYFRKRRALATGLCFSGTAVGSIVQPPLLQHLTRKLGFSYALLILGSIMYTTCLTSMAFRDPVKAFYRTRTRRRQTAPAQSPPSTPTTTRRRTPGSIFLDEEIPALVVETASDDGDRVSLVNMFDSSSDDERKPQEQEKTIKAMDYIGYDVEYVKDIGTDQSDERLLRSTSLDDLGGTRVTHNGPTIQIHSPVEEQAGSSITAVHKAGLRKDVKYSQLSVMSPTSQELGGKRKASLADGYVYPNTNMDSLELQQRNKALVSLSMTTLLLQFETHAEGRYSLLQSTTTNRCMLWVKRHLYVDFTYLKNNVFLVVLCCSSLLLAVYPTGLIFMPPYSISQGIEKTMASVLLSISAAGDLIGRVGCGWMLDKNYCSKQYTLMAGTAVLGSSYLLFAASNMYWLMALCAWIYGMCGGLCFLTIPILLADHHGAQNLGSTFGISRLGQAIVGLCTPPLAGYLKDASGTFTYSFLLMGCTALAGGFIAMTIPYAKRNYRRRIERTYVIRRRPDTDF